MTIKWRDSAWKEVLSEGAQSAIEYLMPDLAADMDPAKEVVAISGMELHSNASDSDKDMRVSDIFFDVPLRSGENGNVAFFIEQQHEPDANLASKIFDTYVRLREKRHVRTTGFALLTGNSADVNTYFESCYGFEVSVKFRSLHLPSKTPDELRCDKRPFARVLLAGRLALDSGGDIGLCEKYGWEILNTTNEEDYEDKKKLFILDFSRRIFQLNRPEISKALKEAYKMQTMPLREYSQQFRSELDKEEGRMEGRAEGKFEVARRMLARNMSVSDIVDVTELDKEDILALR